MDPQDRTRIDDAFDALANRYRRRVLVALARRDPQSGALKVPEAVLPADGWSEGLEIVFYHVHLPKLEDRGFVEWDREARTVAPGPAFEAIRPLVELMDEHSDQLPDDWR
ncbi:MAG: ArsR family transcriptional regulator [Haloferacaceae archaeon]